MTTRLVTIATGLVLMMTLPAWSAQTTERSAKASLAAKPPTATAVIAPKVGPATGNAALNPQPIPPGQGATSMVKPLTTTGNAALNPQPIPPGHAGISTVKPLSTKGNAALNTQPIPPGHALGTQSVQ